MSFPENREYLAKEFMDKKLDYKYPVNIEDKTKNEIPEIKNEIEKKKQEQKEYSKEKLQRMDNREFLTIPLERRLQYITKNNIKSEEVSNKNKKNLEFTFTFDWEYNEELYLRTTAGQVLPKEVKEVTKNGVKYTRNNLKWEFFSINNKRLIIKEWTKIEIWELLEQKEIDKKIEEYSIKTKEFLDNNKKYEEYKTIIEESYNRWIEPELMILTFWQKYNKDNFANKTEIQKRISIEEMFTEFDRIRWKLRLSEEKKSDWKYTDEIAVRMFRQYWGHNWKYYAKEYWITPEKIKKVEKNIKRNFESLDLWELPKWVDWLLTFISQTELWGVKNYNAAFNNANSNQPFDKPLSDLSVREVIQRQKVYKFKHWKWISAAIWAYQFMDYTLQDMIDRNIISWNEKFTPNFQDKIATIKLKARGLNSYMSWRISEKQFLYRLSCEWASLPDPYKNWRSHYDKDWINHSLTSLDNSYWVLQKIKKEWYEPKEEKKEENKVITSTESVKSNIEKVSINEKKDFIEKAISMDNWLFILKNEDNISLDITRNLDNTKYSDIQITDIYNKLKSIKNIEEKYLDTDNSKDILKSRKNAKLTQQSIIFINEYKKIIWNENYDNITNIKNNISKIWLV